MGYGNELVRRQGEWRWYAGWGAVVSQVLCFDHCLSLICSSWGCTWFLGRRWGVLAPYALEMYSEASIVVTFPCGPVSEVLVPGFGRPVLLCRGKMPQARGMAAYVRDGYGAFCQPKFECGCCEMLVFTVCGMRQNLYVYSLYCNPDLDDRIFDCLQASMAAMQAEDVRASFLFVGDLNGQH